MVAARNKETKATEPETVGADIVQSSTYSNADLVGIESFDAAVALVNSKHGAIVDASNELGDGFTLIRTADDLEKLGVKRALLMEWTFRPGDFDKDYVSVRFVAQLQNGTMFKGVYNDGGTGMRRDLYDYTQKTGRTGGLACNGFKVSRYTNEHGPAKTVYLEY